MKKIFLPAVLLLIIAGAYLLFFNNPGSPAEKQYVTLVEKERQEKDSYMKSDPGSPFNQDERAHFQPLKYYDVDPDYIFKSKLFEYGSKDTISIFGTKGEERKAVKFGFVNLNFNDKTYKVNVYKGTSRSGEVYYSIWFTDKTTNKETYGVGRYLDFELNPDKDYVYTIDFNKAYNPYCAYSAKFSCAIPTKEDYLDLAIEAGEKKFHN